MRLAFQWAPDNQEIVVGSDRYFHGEPTNTRPSHDVAHLIAAASGLPWKPAGSREDVCFAEYNAVLVEHLAVEVHRCVVALERDRGRVLPSALEHARWFCTTHYAPFPVPPEEALQRFLAGLDRNIFVRLSPYFFQLKAAESSAVGTWYRGEFDSEDRPAVTLWPLACQRELGRQLRELVTLRP